MRPLLLLAALLPTAAAWGQGKPAPFGAALRKAVTTGAITSGTAYFKSSRNGALVAVTTTVLPKRAGVQVAIARREVGAMRAEETVFGSTLDLDGRTRRIRFDYVRGRQRAALTARVEQRRLLRSDGGSARWDPGWVPFSAAVFLLPRLAGLGSFAPTVFHEGTQRANPKPSAFDRERGGVVLRQVWKHPVLADQVVDVRVRAGALGRIRLGPETLTPITRAAAKKLVPTLESAR